MSFDNYLHNIQREVPFLWEVAEHRLMWLDGGKLMSKGQLVRSQLQAFEVYCTAMMLHEGPKVFTFDALTCESLEHMDANVLGGDYHQPFPSVVICLPPDYIDKRVVAYDGGRTHSPDFVIIRHEPACRLICVGVYLTSKTCFFGGIYYQADQTIESVLRTPPSSVEAEVESLRESGREVLNDQVKVCEQEMDVVTCMKRLAVNACLLATAYGTRCTGPSNPYQMDRLKRMARVKKRPPHHREWATRQMRLMPMLYAFAQEVTLHRREEVGERPEPGEGGGWTVKPHWRRGHWRSQAVGPGRTGRKWVAIPSVLVNEHLFLGGPANTRANYREGKA